MTDDKAPPVASSEDWIAVCSLGGTMQCLPSADGSLMPVAGLDQAMLQSSAPRSIRVLVDNVRVVPSAALDLKALSDVLDAADRHVQDGALAVVVTMGTDMLEKAAFALDLLWDHPQPLVVTGSMRAPTALSADGTANLRSSLLVASSPQAVGLGCVVVLNDEIHAAWQVHKLHTSSPSAFRSPVSGPIGQITEDVVRIVARPMQRPRLPRPRLATTVPVALLTGSLGDDGRLVSSILGLGYQGSGGGSVPPSWSGPLGTVAARIPVVYASRAGSGAVLQRSYGGPGSERDLVNSASNPGNVGCGAVSDPAATATRDGRQPGATTAVLHCIRCPWLVERRPHRHSMRPEKVRPDNLPTPSSAAALFRAHLDSMDVFDDHPTH